MEYRGQQRSDSPRAGASVSGSARKQGTAARKPFAVFDIDGTLIRWQLYHAVTDTLARQGHISPEIYQTMRDARMAWKKRTSGSFKDYEAKVIIIYESILKTITFEQLGEAIDAVFDEYKDQIYTYTRDLIAKLKKNGYLLLAVSGSQDEIVSKVAAYYGFDDFVATTYKRSQNRFSGAKIVPAFNKDKALEKLVATHGAGYRGSIGVGDSLSDVAMLNLVEQPIAFNPEKEFFEYAASKGWRVVVERKNKVYELESKDGKYQLVKTNS
jgi:HAD superfamily hydrolase (TIGR01490 family)